jgi:hypothetical protein
LIDQASVEAGQCCEDGQADQKWKRRDLLLAGGQGVVQAVEGGHQDQGCEEVQARQNNQEDFPCNSFTSTSRPKMTTSPISISILNIYGDKYICTHDDNPGRLNPWGLGGHQS